MSKVAWLMGQPSLLRVAEQLRAFNEEHSKACDVAILVSPLGWTILEPGPDTHGCERLPGGGEPFDSAETARRLLEAVAVAGGIAS
jgi:hypothetical protein